MSKKLRVFSGLFIALAVSGCSGSMVMRTVAISCPSDKVVLICPIFPKFEGRLSNRIVRSRVEYAKLSDACKAETISLWNSEWDRCNNNNK